MPVTCIAPYAQEKAVRRSNASWCTSGKNLEQRCGEFGILCCVCVCVNVCRICIGNIAYFHSCCCTRQYPGSIYILSHQILHVHVTPSYHLRYTLFHLFSPRPYLTPDTRVPASNHKPYIHLQIKYHYIYTTPCIASAVTTHYPRDSLTPSRFPFSCFT